MSRRDKRRSERLAGRFVVAVREKLATWETITEDVSARGCRLELRRPLSPGMLVQLSFDMGKGVEPLVVAGQVTWTTRGPAQSAGIAFLSVPRQAREFLDARCTWRGWIDRLLGVYVRQIDQGPARPPAGGVHERVERGPAIIPPVP